jgi:DNA-binding NarL/FixJ family response regulator
MLRRLLIRVSVAARQRQRDCYAMEVQRMDDCAMQPPLRQRPIRIVLLDDHEVVLHGLTLRLAQEPDFAVVGAYGASRQLITALDGLPADLLVIDYVLGKNQIDGLNLIRLLRVRFPESRILVSSAHDNAATVLLAMRAGARGYVGKRQELSVLVSAIRTVAAGGVYVSPMMEAEVSSKIGLLNQADNRHGTATLTSHLDLSPREQEVLRCLLDGMSVTEVAGKFARSVKTISTQKRAAYRKLGIHSDNELFKIRLDADDL